MKNRLWIGAVLLVLVGGLAVWKIRQRESGETPAPSGGKTGKAPDLAAVFPKIDSKAIDALEIKGPETPEPVKLAKKGNTWNVIAPLDAPADQEAASNVVEKLSELKVRRIVAENPENHERLGLTDDKATHVTASAGGKPVLTLLVGGYGAGDTMVRKPGENTVYGVEGSISYVFNKDLRSWRERKLLDIEVAGVVDAQWDNGKTHFHFVRDPKDGNGWIPGPKQKPIKDFDASKVQSAAMSLAKIRASDFAAPNETAESLGITSSSPTATLTVQLPKTEGMKAVPAPMKYVLRLGKKSETAGQFYAALEGNPTVVVITEFLSKRLAPTAEEFQKSKEPPPSEAGAEAPQMPPGMAGPGGQQIPPDVLRQLQAQMQNQQAQGQ